MGDGAHARARTSNGERAGTEWRPTGRGLARVRRVRVAHLPVRTAHTRAMTPREVVGERRR